MQQIEEGRKLDHLIVEMNELSNSTTIFKVHVGLRESKPATYNPMFLSIGPYHNKSPKLRSMEKYKLLYLRRFLKRKRGIDENSCIRELEKLKENTLMCYDDIDNFDKDIVGKFSEIMLLDGCFVVEFIRELFGIRPREEHFQLVIDKAWMIYQVLRDMVVLENQLPFFVLTMLHDMTKCPNEESFLCMVRRTLLDIPPKMAYIPKSEIDRLNAEQFDHLLHVLHMVSCPSETINSRQSTNASKKKGFCNINLFFTEYFAQLSKENRDIPDLWHSCFIPNATELYEAGVSFTKIGSVDAERMDSTTLLDITTRNVSYCNGY